MKKKVQGLLLLCCLMILMFIPQKVKAADYTDWSGWQTNHPGYVDGRQIESKEVIDGYNVVSFIYQKAVSPYQRVYLSHSINGQYSAYGFRSSYGEHPRSGVATKEQIDTARRVNPGTYMSTPSRAAGWLQGDGTIYFIPTLWEGWEPWYIQSEIKHTEYRYRDEIKDPFAPYYTILNQQINLKFQCKSNGISLSWDQVYGATGYIIYRDGKQIKKITSGSTVKFLDKDAKTSGKKYVYEIRIYITINGVQKLGEKSQKNTVCYLKTMTAPTVSAVAGGIKITWSSNANCEGYQICYSTSSDFSGAKYKTVTGLNSTSKTILDLGTVKYYIRIRCFIKVNGVKVYSPWSSAKYCTPKIKKYSYKGRVTDAATGKSMANATVIFRKGKNKKSGTIYCTTTTDSKGYYSAKLPKGNYTIEVKKSGYVVIYIDIYIEIDVTVSENPPICISKPLPSGQYRAVLRWNNKPRDLDSHLLGKGSFGEFELSYKIAGTSPYKVYLNGTWQATLDIDDTDGKGPETTTFPARSGATYTYYVFNYSGADGEDTALSASGAVVDLYKGNTKIATYKVPNKSGIAWCVFSISNGTVKKINTMSNLEEDQLVIR